MYKLIPWRPFLVILVTFDESGSIRYSDFYKVKDAVGELVDKLTEDDRVAIFTFDDIVRLHTDFVDKKTASDVLFGLRCL